MTRDEALVVDVYCESCMAPGHITPHGYFCEQHAVEEAPVCEMCGERAAVVIEAGYMVCLHGRCLAIARGTR